MDSSVLSIKSEKTKGTLKNLLPGFFVFFFLFFLLLLLLWTMETERSCIKGEKGKGDFLEGRRHSPASHLPHCPIDHSRKAGLTRSMGILIIEHQRTEPQLVPASVLGALHTLLHLILSYSARKELLSLFYGC